MAIAALTEWSDRVKPLKAGALARARHLPRAAYGMTCAHLGFAFVIAGVTADTAWKQEHIQTQAPGQSVDLGTFRLEAGETLIVLARTLGRQVYAHSLGGELVDPAAPEAADGSELPLSDAVPNATAPPPGRPISTPRP